MVLPGEDPSEISKAETVWSHVSKWMTLEDAELIRCTVYTFRSANADEWRSDRILIAGDAAHLMPPFLGQGMCSGIRDVANLSWKLDLVLRGLANEALLDSYMLERKPHVGSIIEQAVALGRVSCIVDPEEAKRRDEAFLTGRVPPAPPFPWITKGIVNEKHVALAGRLGPQARVEFAGRTGLADDIVGPGWQFIGKLSTFAAISPEARQILEILDVRIMELDAADGIRDIDQTYHHFLAGAGVDAVLVRPDFYIFGAVYKDCTLTELVLDLAAKLGLSQRPVNR